MLSLLHGVRRPLPPHRKREWVDPFETRWGAGLDDVVSLSIPSGYKDGGQKKKIMKNKTKRNVYRKNDPRKVILWQIIKWAM